MKLGSVLRCINKLACLRDESRNKLLDFFYLLLLRYMLFCSFLIEIDDIFPILPLFRIVLQFPPFLQCRCPCYTPFIIYPRSWRRMETPSLQIRSLLFPSFPLLFPVQYYNWVLEVLVPLSYKSLQPEMIKAEKNYHDPQIFQHFLNETETKLIKRKENIYMYFIILQNVFL